MKFRSNVAKDELLREYIYTILGKYLDMLHSGKLTRSTMRLGHRVGDIRFWIALPINHDNFQCVL